MVRRRTTWGTLALLALPIAAIPQEGAAQSDLEVRGLLRAGVRVEPDSSARSDGFDVFDARLGLSGKIGIIFDYFVQVEYDEGDDEFKLLDARAGLPIRPEADIGLGLFRPAFGLEALTDKGQLTFLERSQATEAIAPGRQVGVGLSGEAADARLTYGVGVFNGNGRRLENDGGDYMFAGRVQYNTIGPVPFYEDFVLQAGASAAYSEDTAAELGAGFEGTAPGVDPIGLGDAFAGDRFLWEVDVHASYRGWSLTAEYLRGEYDAELGPETSESEVSLDAYGGYVEAGYLFWGGAIEAVARYDGFSPAVGENRDFVLFGINIFPGQYAKFGLQYAMELHDSPPSPFLDGGQFLLVAQVDF
jgi:phosphate-selective porin